MAKAISQSETEDLKEDLKIALVKNDDELDKTMSDRIIKENMYSEFNASAFLECQTNDEKINFLERKAAEKNNARDKWVRGSSNESEESKENFDINCSDEDNEELKETQNTKWYDQTLQNVFNGRINDFIKARELYQSVIKTSDSGYLYKLRDKTNLLTDYLKKLESISTSLYENLDGAQNKLDKCINSDDCVGKNIASKLNTINALEIFNAIKSKGKEDQDLLNAYKDILREIITKLSIENYFNVQEPALDTQDIQKNGSVYKPGIFHSWSVNLSWLLAHLQKGNRFHILSDVFSNKNRQSKPELSEEYSAFFREICSCLKAGYILEKNDNIVTLSPSVLWRPEICVTNGSVGDGINPSSEEMDKIFEDLQIHRDKPNYAYTYLNSNTQEDTLIQLRENLEKNQTALNAITNFSESDQVLEIQQENLIFSSEQSIFTKHNTAIFGYSPEDDNIKPEQPDNNKNYPHR